MDTSTDALLGTLLDGRYRLDARIARGGMATVYAGFDTRLDRPVAVKVMHASLAEDDAFVERFRREARAAARLAHPSVVAIYDQGEDAGLVYLVMEHVAGRTLREALRTSGRLGPARALDVVAGVLVALDAAHRAGLVHRDVKPENVLVLADGTVKVADFGLARAIEATNHTVADGTLLGTVAYLAPEQAASGAADPRTDLYALGVVLYEAVTGTVPFTGDTPLAVAYRHVNEDVPLPSSVVPGLPPAVDDVVRAATRRAPEERYPDAATMLSAVRRARAPLASDGDDDDAPTTVLPLGTAPAHPTQALPVRPGPPAPVKRRRPKRRRRLVLLAIAVVVLLVAGLGGWWLGTGRYARAPRVVGLSPSAAAARLRDAGLKPRTGKAEFSDTVAAGAVAGQDPAAGTRVRRGSTVTIHPSLGVRTVRVPDLRGYPQADAKIALERAGLALGAVTRRYDDVMTKGKVVATSVPAGTTLRHDTAVGITVSDGPAPVTVPDVRGRAADEATRALRDAGLVVTTTREFDDEVAKDHVITTDPAPGAVVTKGARVTLRVSRGPETVSVPDLRGEDIDFAKRALADLGLKADVRHVRGGHGHTVLDQDPEPGTEVRVGTTVTLVAF